MFVHKKQTYLFFAWIKADFLENCTLLVYYAAYRGMAKDPMEMAELKTSHLLKKSTYACRGGVQATTSCGHRTAKVLWTS